MFNSICWKELWVEKSRISFLILNFLSLYFLQEVHAQENLPKGDLLYENPFSSAKEVSDWTMEGPGTLDFLEGWMYMQSPEEEGHHVFWCPRDFPSSFVAQWEMQNIETDAGLCIVFFAATGVNGEDIFDPKLKKREGVFKQYTKSDLNTYHISYYANAAHNPNRPHSHLRKNKGFYKVFEGEQGIPPASTDIHHITLVKEEARIQLYVDDRKVIDWVDDGETYGPVLQGGKMGFRQMKWTHFRYRNFKVWGHKKNKQPAWPRRTIDDMGSGADGVKLGDMDQDGKMDIVTGWEESGITKVYLHPGVKQVRGKWPKITVGNTPQVEDAVFADLDGDGQLEIISATEGKTQTIFIHSNGSNGKADSQAWRGEILPASKKLTQWMYAEPLQVDGKKNVDLIVGGKGKKGLIGWFEAPRKGSQWEKWKWNEMDSVGWVMSILLEDMDGDGDKDVVITDRYGKKQGCRWLENPGDRRAQKQNWQNHWIGAKGLEVMFMTLVDINGDGKKEALVPERTTPAIHVFTPEGASWVKASYPLPREIGQLKSIEVGDINLDGIPDWVISTNTYGPGKVGLFWVDGGKVKPNRPLSYQSISGVHEAKFDKVVLWDIDEDGDLDVLTCEENYGPESRGLGVIWYENMGD